MKKKLRLLISVIIFCLFSTQQLKSQPVIQGIIKDAEGKLLQFSNVLLLKSTDSSLVKGMITDASGKYSFESIKNGNYLVTATFTGMNQVYTKIFEVTPGKKEINLSTLYLKNGNVQLQNVTIAVKKPMFEQKIDRMIINVKNSITDAGGTALDVLEKSPGVTVNRQNNSITINGKNGVVVMINGKITYMPMDALVQLLAATSADNIEKMELITTPPSKYDAEGNAGYINIVLLNNPYEGISGSYFINGGYGKKELGGGGINFNYRSSKINLFGNYSFRYIHYIQPGSGLTQFIKAGNIITNTSFSNRDATTKIQDARIGIDYQLDPATIIGALIGGYDSHWAMIAHNGATISKNNMPDTTISTFNSEVNHWQNITTNLNFQHTFKPGKIFYCDANYIYYKDNNPNAYSNTYNNNAKEFLYHEDLKSGKVTPINFRVLSSDYTTPLGKKITVEAGAKISLSEFSNGVSVSKLKEGIYVPDSSLSANYLLNENIAAAYTSLSINLNSKLSMKAGLRYEYTTSNLGTTETANIVNRKYGELFPTFYISQKLNEDNSLSFSYSRRITRPSFNDLAPFTIFFDPKTFFSGNPALQPAIANSIQASYGLKNYIFSLSYTHEHNTIESFYFQTQKIDTVRNILYLSANNFNFEQYLNASFSMPFTVNKWWSMQNNLSYNWRQVNTTFNKAPVQFQSFNYSLNSTQRFKLPGDFSVELTGFYLSASYFGTTKFKPLYRLDAGLQKKFNNKEDMFRFTANDIFNSGSNYKFVDNLSMPGSVVNRNFNFGLVSYKLGYTHNFGNKALKGKRERSTGAEDELNRVHN